MRSEELIRLRGDSEEREKAEGTFRFFVSNVVLHKRMGKYQLLTIEPNLYELTFIEGLCQKHKAVEWKWIMTHFDNDTHKLLFLSRDIS